MFCWCLYIFVVCVACFVFFLSFFFLMIRRPPRSTRETTLFLHDALPIFLDSGMTRVLPPGYAPGDTEDRSEEHTSELQSQSHISYAVFCLKKKKKNWPNSNTASSASTGKYISSTPTT